MQRFIVKEVDLPRYSSNDGTTYHHKLELVFINTHVIYLIEWHDDNIFKVLKYGTYQEVNRNTIKLLKELFMEEK